MRWRGQGLGVVDAAALPGMEHLHGLVKSVTTPDFAGVTFHEVMAKSALNHVPGGSSMPFDWTVNPYRGCSHACTYCVVPDTLVLLESGGQIPIGEIRVGDRVVGTVEDGSYRRYAPSIVQAAWRTRKRAYRVTLADGTEIVASGDHRFLTERGWKHVVGATSGADRRPHLTLHNRLQGFGMGGDTSSHLPAWAPPAPGRTVSASAGDVGYRRGYLAGMIRGDACVFRGEYRYPHRAMRITSFRLALADTEALDRTRTMLTLEGVRTRTRPFVPASPTRRAMTALHTARSADVDRIEALISTPDLLSPSWAAGFLAGIFDAEGSCSRGVLRISNSDPDSIALTQRAMQLHKFDSVVEPPRTNGVRTVRVRGGLPARRRFFDIVAPAIGRKASLVGAAVKTTADLRIVAIEALGEELEMVDITTSTGDFIANGVVSHNCFARGTHEYLDLDAGLDFDSQVVVKVNVAEVLRRELARGSWHREPVALGTNTDPYQRAEGRYRLMPGIVSALADSGTPFSILTKGTMLRRDLPMLQEAAREVKVSIAMSIAVFDDALQKAIEPGTPSASARLATVRAATDAGFAVTVFLMPIIPHLTDSVPAIDDALRRIKEAGAVRVVYGALHLRPGAKGWFMTWLQREHPELVSSYLGLYPGVSAYAPKAYRSWLAKRVRPLLRVHGLDGAAEDDRPDRPTPVPGVAAAPPRIVTTTRGRASARRDAAAMLF